MTFAEVRTARALLERYLPVTSLRRANSLSTTRNSHSSTKPSPADPSRVFLKMESELPTGSFKPRGAVYALAVNLARGPIREVVASSTGNHGAAVAYAAQLLGVPARIFLPENPNPVKRARILALGAEVVEVGVDSAAGYLVAVEYAASNGAFFLNDGTDPDLLHGPAVIACEIIEQLPEVETLVVPMGDTALIRGVAFAAKHLKPAIRIVGVQAEQAPSYYLSWKAGKATPTETCVTIADGLATRTPEEANVATVRELVEDVVLVSEVELLGAVRWLMRHEDVVAEPAGAAATAAWLRYGVAAGWGASVVCLMTGGNVSDEIRFAAARG